MNLAHACALAAGLALLGGGLWHLALGGAAQRSPALPNRSNGGLAPVLPLPSPHTEGPPPLSRHAAAANESIEAPVADPIERTSVPVAPPDLAAAGLDAEEHAQLDLGLVNPGAQPVETDRSGLARDRAPQLAAELGWALAEEQTQLLGTWLAGHERRERRLREAERGQSPGATQARDDLRGWFQSFDALFGEERGLALRKRLQQP